MILPAILLDTFPSPNCAHVQNNHVCLLYSVKIFKEHTYSFQSLAFNHKK